MMAYSEKEREDYLKSELTEYEKIIGGITADEKKALHAWVASGNSPYENPHLLYSESGCPMDFVTAARVNADMVRSPQDYMFA
jgi:hypothetical protein